MYGKENVMRNIDARGLACPAPVLEAKKAVEEGATRLRVVVDNGGSQENVRLFLESRGFTVVLSRDVSDFIVTASRTTSFSGPIPDSAIPPCPLPAAAPESPKEASRRIMVLVSSDRMGRGDDELGGKLMTNFLRTLKEMGPDLWRLVFVNGGVTLTVEGAGVLPDLQALEGAGVTILVCGTCLDHFGLLERKKVGQTTNMLDIVTAMQLAGSVVTL